MIISIEDVCFTVIIDTFFAIVSFMDYITFVIMGIKNGILSICAFTYYSSLKYLFLNGVEDRFIIVICFLIKGCIAGLVILYLFVLNSKES